MQSAVVVSVDPAFSPSVELKDKLAVLSVTTELTSDFVERLRDGQVAQRVRLIGEPRDAIATPLGADAVDVQLFTDDVTLEPELEGLPFVLEQTVSMTAHRFGDASPWTASVLPVK